MSNTADSRATAMNNSTDSLGTTVMKSIASNGENSRITVSNKSPDGLGTTIINKSTVSNETEAINKSAEVVDCNNKVVIDEIDNFLPDTEVRSELIDIFSNEVNEIHPLARTL